MRQIVIFAVLLLVVATALVQYADRVGKGPAPTPSGLTASAAPSPAPSSGPRSVVLNRDRRGHFQVDARVDGRRMEFVVDTGASHIALRESDAARLGIHPSRRDYTIKTSTANGIIAAAPIRLSMVEVGGIIVRDVTGFVLPDQALSENLLGMSFLSRVKWNHERGKLTIEQ
jgi:aspartyl protease family protein